MASYTSFLNLEKPTTSERLDVLKINSNWDKIDAGVSALNSHKEDKTTVNALIKTKIQSVTFDNNGAWGAWGADVDMAGYALIYASPNAWAPTTILCDKDGFYSLSCPSKAGQTVTYKLVGIKANVVH